MRIISGVFRGKKLFAPVNIEIRPTLDRVKETLFNCINFDILNCSFLDLFAGSGAIGIEAISRKASEVVFVEKDKENLKTLQKNLQLIKNDSAVLNLDFLDALASLTGKKFDFIYIDPPYQSNFYQSALETIDRLKMLSPTGEVICEHKNDSAINSVGKLIKTRTKKIGAVSLSFFRCEGSL